MARFDRLSPMQASVLEVPETINIALLGGRGGGKTTAALLLGINHIVKHGDAANVLYARKTYGALSDLTDEFRLLIGELTGGSYDFNKHELKARLLGGTLQFVAVDDAKSYDRVQGSNRTMLIVDEVTQHRSERVLRLLRSNLRAPKGMPTRVVYVGNPGGPLHGLVHKRHIVGQTPYRPYSIALDEDGKTADSEEWITVPSTANDNPFIDVGAYISKLREACHGDPVRLAQWLYGDWAEGAGLMFPAWDDAVHVLTMPPDYRIDRDQFVFHTATDWGLVSPSVSLLGLTAKRAITLPNGTIAPRGSVIVLDEVTDAIMDDPENLSRSREWPPSRLAARIVSKSTGYGIARPNGVVDDARGLRGETLIDEMSAEGFGNLTKPRKGLRAEGWARIASMLQAAADRDPARAHLYVTPACKYLLATLPAFTRDETDPDDVADIPSCPDHGGDALRYLLGDAQRPTASQGWTRGYF